MAEASIARTAKRRSKKLSLEVKQRRYGYWFTLPFIVGVIIFVIIPVIESVIFSFNDISFDNAVGEGTWDRVRTLLPEVKGGVVTWFGQSLSFIGIGNYHQIWAVDDDFRKQILDSLANMATQVPIVVIFAFFMASVLNTKFIGRGFARSVMFLPVIISSGLLLNLSGSNLAADLISSGDRFASTAGETFQVTTAFEMMLENMDLDQGLISFIVGAVSNISTIVTLSAVSIVIFMAGLQSISPSIYEASYIEGATKWEVFWKISLPMVSPLILLSVVYTIVDAFNSTSNSVIYTIHTKIIGTDYDVASAMAVSYSLIILAILAVVFLILNRIVFYQD